MSTLTKNLKLTKPDATKNYSVDTYNANWAMVDMTVSGAIGAWTNFATGLPAPVIFVCMVPRLP